MKELQKYSRIFNVRSETCNAFGDLVEPSIGEITPIIGPDASAGCSELCISNVGERRSLVSIGTAVSCDFSAGAPVSLLDELCGDCSGPVIGLGEMFRGSAAPSPVGSMFRGLKGEIALTDSSGLQELNMSTY